MQFTNEHLATYERDGYVIVRQFFAREEVDLLYNLATSDELLSQKTYDRTDASGLKRGWRSGIRWTIACTANLPAPNGLSRPWSRCWADQRLIITPN